MIRKVFSSHKINFSLIKAGILPFDFGIDFPEFIEWSQPDRDFYPTGEGGYTALMTLQGRGHFQGGEPTDLQIKNALVAASWQPSDILGYYLLRSAIISNKCDNRYIGTRLLQFFCLF